MRSSVRIAPPNSLLFVSDVSGGISPQIKKGPRMWATSSCISVGCLAFMDGKTEVTLGASNEVDPGRVATFEGLLDTPNRTVIVSTVEKEVVLELKVRGRRTRVRIWTNHPKEPDKVIIGLE